MPNSKISHVGGFIVRKNLKTGFDVLLVKRDLAQTKFFLPTGKIEPQENEFDSGPREIREETGLDDLQLVADLGIVNRNGRDEAGNKYLKTIKYLDGKTFYCQWLPIESFPDQIQF